MQRMRSLLFVPGHNEKFLHKSMSSDADIIIIDFEDSVPKRLKATAREVASNFLQEKKSKPVFFRINDLESGHALKDLDVLKHCYADGIMCPKIRDSFDVRFYDEVLSLIERENESISGYYKMILLIETASSIMNLSKICSFSERTIAAAFGSEDFAADLKLPYDTKYDFTTIQTLLSVACHSNNIVPINTVHVDVHNLEELDGDLKKAKDLGFKGTLVLHPKEIELAHKYFTPSEKEIEWAKSIVFLAQKADDVEKGVAVIGGKFIGPPFVRVAKDVLQCSEKFKEQP